MHDQKEVNRRNFKCTNKYQEFCFTSKYKTKWDKKKPKTKKNATNIEKAFKTKGLRCLNFEMPKQRVMRKGSLKIPQTLPSEGDFCPVSISISLASTCTAPCAASRRF
ncbi:hypothetical protein V6Z11_D02G190700 [Gossypium hirsutum]